jgi:hypothetical protein
VKSIAPKPERSVRKTLAAVAGQMMFHRVRHVVSFHSLSPFARPIA